MNFFIFYFISSKAYFLTSKNQLKFLLLISNFDFSAKKPTKNHKAKKTKWAVSRRSLGGGQTGWCSGPPKGP
jgi:hypothetical protein